METGTQVKTETVFVEAKCVICADLIAESQDTLTDLPNEEREVDWTKFLCSFLSVKCVFPLADIYGCGDGGNEEIYFLRFCIPCRQVCLQVVDINAQIQQLMLIVESMKRNLKMKVRKTLNSENNPDSPYAHLLRDLIVDTSVVLTPVTVETQPESVKKDNGFVEVACYDSDSDWSQPAESNAEDNKATELIPQDCVESVLAEDDGYQHLDDSVAFSGADSNSKRRRAKKQKATVANLFSKTASSSSFNPDQVVCSKPFPAIPKGQSEYMGVVIYLGDRYNAKYQDSKCGLCGFVFSRKDNCIKHIKTVHIDENGEVKNNVRIISKTVKCGVCGSQFVRPSKCKEHINKFHEGVGVVIHLANTSMRQESPENVIMKSQNCRNAFTDERVDAEENREISPTPSARIVDSGHQQEKNPHLKVLRSSRSVRNIKPRIALESKASTTAKSRSTASSFLARRRLRTRSLQTALTGRTVFMGAPMYIGDKCYKNGIHSRYTKCGLCGFIFTRKDHCQSHIKSVHIDENGEVLKTLPKNFRKSFKCDVCGYLFATRKGCKLHGQSFHNGAAKVVQMPKKSKMAQMEASVNRDNDFAMDNDNVEEEIQLAESSVGYVRSGNGHCETSRTDSEITENRDPDVNESQEAATCDSPRSAEDIKEAEQAPKHILTVPTSRQMYMGVEIHVADTGNDGNRPTKCGVCQYVFTRKDQCQKHIKNVHIGDDGKVRMNIKIVHKRMKCGVCNVLFTTKKTCRNHIRKFHNGDGDVVPLEKVKKVAALSNKAILKNIDERTLVNCTNEVMTEDAKMKSAEPKNESTEDGFDFVVTPSTSQMQTRRSNRVDYKKLQEQALLSEDEDADNLGEESNDDDDDYAPEYIAENRGSVDEGKLAFQIDKVKSLQKHKRRRPRPENGIFHTSEDGRFWFKDVEIIRSTTEFGITEYLCSICTKENQRHRPSRIKYKIRDHILKVHINPKRPCSTKVYPDGRMTYKGIEILKVQDPYGFDGYNCGLCENPMWFDTSKNVIRHIWRCHGGSRKNKSVAVSTKGMRQFKRRKTGRLFFKQFEFKKMGPTTYSCCTCDDLKIYSATRIKTHIRLAHIGPDETWHKCHLCEKEFSTKRLLEDHLEFHGTERKYICDICGKSFRCRPNLDGHQRTHDESKRIFECKFCEKRFFHIRDQRVHERSHTKEKPFMCEMCPATFKVMHLLNKHLKTQHQDAATT